MKNISKILVLAVFVLLAAPLAACSSSKKKLVAVYAVTFYNPSIEMEVGHTAQLEYKVFPVNASYKDVEFYSSDPSVATVTGDGRVTLHYQASAEITVRTKDGGYTSVCKVSPVLKPEGIQIDTTKTEQKYINNEVVEQLYLSVGQSSALPVTLLPVGASSSLLNVVSNNDNVEVVYSAQWYVIGNKVGSSKITVTCDQQTCVVDVIVTPLVSNASVRLGSNHDSIIEQKSESTYAGEMSIDLDGPSAVLNIALYDLNQTLLKKTGISVQVADDDICEVSVVDTMDEFVDLFDPDTDEEREMFNALRYMTITPKADGVTKIYILCDATATNGLPVQIELEVSVTDDVYSVDTSVDTKFESGNNRPLVYAGDAFSVNSILYVRIAGDELYPITSGRKVYYKFNSNNIASISNSIGGGYYESNQFVAKVREAGVIIDVYVAKTGSVKEITEYTDIEIQSLYIHETISFDIEDKISDVYIGFGGVLQNGDEIVFTKSTTVDEVIESLEFGVVKAAGGIVTDASWKYLIETSNENVVYVDGVNIKAKNTDGFAELTVKITDGVKTYSKTIIIDVIQK